MARENQGLKGALIVFVLLTIVFAVITAILFSQQNTLKQEAKQAADARRASDKAAMEALKQMETLKTKMGFDPKDSMETVEKGFSDDMKEYLASFPKGSQSYRKAIEYFEGEIKKKISALKQNIEDINQQKAEILAVNAKTQQQINGIKDDLTKAQQDLAAEIQKYTDSRLSLENQQKQDAANLQAAHDGYKKALKDQKDKLEDVNTQLVNITGNYKRTKDRIYKLTQEKPDVFLGLIKWVNQDTKTVWINLGSADGLRPQITFSIYAPGASETSEITKKASVRVTKVLRAHLAEAQILEDQATDPILPGDKIFTPIWSKGERRHFALTGFADIDGDGIDDRNRIYALIELNGGVVDARMGRDGKRDGVMTLDTRYLIVGKTPDVTSTPELLKDFSDMDRDATDLNVEKISLQKFLEMMGWKHEAQVVDSKTGVVPVEVNQSPPTSTGNISDLFKPRRPPRSFGGSVF
ncbi:MAG: hypothetical protein PVH19_09240 [Planctomycetia bacterium]|jgi:hypothetical protein